MSATGKTTCNWRLDTWKRNGFWINLGTQHVHGKWIHHTVECLGMDAILSALKKLSWLTGKSPCSMGNTSSIMVDFLLLCCFFWGVVVLVFSQPTREHPNAPGTWPYLADYSRPWLNKKGYVRNAPGRRILTLKITHLQRKIIFQNIVFWVQHVKFPWWLLKLLSFWEGNFSVAILNFKFPKKTD